MNTEEITAYLKAMPAVESDYKSEWEATRFMLGGKMFAYIGCDKSMRPLITLKLPPQMSEALRKEHDFIREGYYMNKVHWSSVYLDVPCPDELMKLVLNAAYQTLFSALPKKCREKVESENL